jgi:hypothetical protein
MTPEWAAAYTEAWNNDEEIMKKLRRFSSVIKYSISDREDLEPIVIEIENGICTSYGIPELYDKIEYEVWADSESWQKVFDNHDNIKKVMKSDGFGFKGPKLKALSNKSGLERSVELMLEMKNVSV